MRVALLSDHFLPQIGGIEIHVSELAQQLKRRGHEPLVLTAMPKAADLPGIEVCRIEGPKVPGTKIVWHPKTLRTLRAIFSTEKVDVVHSHLSIVSPLAYAGAFVAQSMKIPALMTAHSLFSLGSRVSFRILNRILKFNSGQIRLSAVSREAARRMQRVFPGPPVHLLPNGFDSGFWNSPPQKKERLRITSVMRLHRKKKPETLLRTLAMIHGQGSLSKPPVLTLVGDGPLRKKLEGMAAAGGLRDHVEFRGFLPVEEIKKILETSTVFALPSPWESFGRTALEAAGMGVPVVGMEGSGVGEIIQNGENGFLARDVPGFARGVCEILADPGLREKFSTNIRQRAQLYSWDRVLDCHEDLYRQALTGTKLKDDRGDFRENLDHRRYGT